MNFHPARSSRASLFVAAVATLLSSVAADRVAAEDLLPPLMRPCTTLKNSAERLACFDRASVLLAAGKSDAGEAPSPTAVFGISDNASTAPAPSANAPQRDELKSLTAVVKSVRTDRDGFSIVELDNGQVWRQLGGASELMLEQGHPVTISRGMLGSFLLSTPSGRSAKVKRIR